VSENDRLRIEFYNTVRISIQNKLSLVIINLIDVVYIFDFFTNFVSYNKLRIKNVFINGRNNRLKRNKYTFYYLQSSKSYILIKNNTTLY